MSILKNIVDYALNWWFVDRKKQSADDKIKEDLELADAIKRGDGKKIEEIRLRHKYT